MLTSTLDSVYFFLACLQVALSLWGVVTGVRNNDRLRIIISILVLTSGLIFMRNIFVF